MKTKPLLVLFVTVFVDLVGFGIIIPLNPYLSREFGASPLQVGLLMAIYSLMQFLFSPFWGQLSDYFGRRPIILMSLLGASLSHLGFAFGTDLSHLFIARAFAGICGANISTAMAAIADITKEKDRAKGMGLIGAAFGLGFMLGPFIGGIVGHWGEMLGDAPPFGPSLAAVAAAVICFANFVFAYTSLPESLASKLSKQSSVSVWEAYKNRPARLKRVWQALSRPTLGCLMGMYFMSSLAMAHMEASLFMFVQDRFTWTLAQASMGFAYVGLIMVLTQGVLIRRLLPVFGERKLLFMGLALSAFSLAGIGFSHSIPILAVMVTLLGLGSGLSSPSLMASVSLLSSEAEQGGHLGVNQSLAALGRILGPAAGGYFYQQLGVSSPFWIAGGLMFISILMGLSIYSRIPEKARMTK